MSLKSSKSVDIIRGHSSAAGPDVLRTGELHRRPRSAQPAARDVLEQRVCRGGRTNILWREAWGDVLSRRGRCGQDPRHSLSGCTAGVPPPCARSLAPAAWEEHHRNTISRTSSSLLRSLSCLSESQTCRPPQARKRSYLWPAVDQHGDILDILVSRWRGKGTAKRGAGPREPGRGTPGGDDPLIRGGRDGRFDHPDALSDEACLHMVLAKEALEGRTACQVDCFRVGHWVRKSQKDEGAEPRFSSILCPDMSEDSAFPSAPLA